MKFSLGEEIDWVDKMKGTEPYNTVGPGPFFIRTTENCCLEPNGHRQWVSLRKKADGKLYCWSPFKNAWIEDVLGPPYMCIPPTFSNICFKRA